MQNQHLNLRQMIGQLLVIGFPTLKKGSADLQAIKEQIAEGLIGGVLLFKHNIESPAQLLDLTQTLHGFAGEVPLFIAVDQEGGKVQRLGQDNGFTKYPSAQDIGKRSPEQAERCYLEMAAELAAHGINLNFAPCVDLDLGSAAISAHQRSFGSHVDVVTSHAQRFVQAHRQHGVLTALKHFPGHGSAQGDTHAGLVDNTKTWTEHELEPFRKLISANAADMVVGSHLFNRNIDPKEPATFSHATITGLLRERLKFQGPIVTDDLHMGAIGQHYPKLKDVVSRAILAGNDMLVLSNNPSAAKGVANFRPDSVLSARIVSIVEHLIEAGALTRERIAESCSRILACKEKLRK